MLSCSAESNLASIVAVLIQLCRQATYRCWGMARTSKTPRPPALCGDEMRQRCEYRAWHGSRQRREYRAWHRSRASALGKHGVPHRSTAAQLLLDWPDWFHIRARDMLGTAGNSRQPNAYQQSTLVTHQRDGGGGKAGEQGNECSTRLRT